MKNLLFILKSTGIGIILFAELSAAPNTADLGVFKVDAFGGVTYGGTRFSLCVYDKDFRSYVPSEATTKHRALSVNGARVSWKSILLAGTHEITADEQFTLKDDGSLDLEISLEGTEAFQAKEACIMATCPVDEFAGRIISVDNEQIFLPLEKPIKPALLKQNAYRTCSIPFQDARLYTESDGSILVQDSRAWNARVYELRFGLRVTSTAPFKAAVRMRFSASPYGSRPIDMKTVMNRSFADEDGSGWTGQGPGNDLRMLRPVNTRLGGITYEIVDPAINGGRSCIVLGGTPRTKSFPGSATIPVNGIVMKHLYLLHAAAWAPATQVPIGTISVDYTDGTKQEFAVVNRQDVADWFSPSALSNGAVVWTGENKTSMVGLYASAFTLQEKHVANLSFESAGNSIWMIIAASGADERIPVVKSAPVMITVSPEWRPMVFPRRVSSGSALDFSRFVDAPAGKYGRVGVYGGKFAFERFPEKPVRFFGGNLMPGRLSNHSTADEYAARLAESGYNAVRLHMFDIMLTKGGSNSVDLNPERLEQMDYLIHALRQRGIYFTLDLFCWRVLRKEEVPELGRVVNDMQDYKALALLVPSVLENLKSFSKNLLTHRNPYTGTRWGDDPALISVNLINEGKVKRLGTSADVKELYQQRFAKWLAEKYPAVTDEQDRARMFDKFLHEVYAQALSNMRAFTREFGVTAPLSDQNDGYDMLHALLVEPNDYVDNHYYYDWPRFSGPNDNPPFTIQNQSEVAQWAPPLATCFPTRIFGKPFTISEFGTAYPNRYRGASGILCGAYAALQDWDAVYRFLPDGLREGPANLWEAANDPICFLSDRLGSLLFLRGDVKASELELPVALSSTFLEDGHQNDEYPAIYKRLGFLGKTGSIVVSADRAAWPSKATTAFVLNDARIPAAVAGIDLKSLSANAVLHMDFNGFGPQGNAALDEDRREARSSTGELVFNAGQGSFTAVTPRSEVLIVPGPGLWRGSILSASNAVRNAIFSASALDGADLRHANRILICHLTEVVNSRLRFSGTNMKTVEDHGVLPLLARRGEASLSLALGTDVRPASIFALDLAGRRMYPVTGNRAADGTLTFKVDTFAGPEPCMVYEIIR